MAVLGLSAPLWAGCSGERGRDIAILEGRCSFATQHELAPLDATAVDDLAVVADGAGAAAVWSDDGGLFLLRLDAEAAPVGPASRLGPPCPGGVDLASADGLFVACGQPAHPGRGDAGRVVVYAVEGERAVLRERFEPMAEDARGVAIAVDERELLVAWHDARRGSASVWRVRLPRAAEAPLPEALGELAALARPTPIRLSREEHRAGPPSVLLMGGHAWVAWAETTLDDAGDPIGDVLVRTDDDAPRSVATIQHETADPRLHAAQDRVLVSYRDRRERGRPQGYALWVPARGETGTLARLSPSNLDSPALLVPCMGSAIAVVPRTHSRHERLVSVREHALDTLEGRGPELQLYEHGEAYEHAAAACVPGTPERLLVLYAARENDEHEPGRLLTATVRCTE